MMPRRKQTEVALLYCAVLYEVMPHMYLIMHKQTILIKGVYWHAMPCSFAVDVCAIPDNISELVQKVVELCVT